MSKTPESRPEADKDPQESAEQPESAERAEQPESAEQSEQSERVARAKARAALVFDDPLSRPSADDTDHGWGERPSSGDGAADLARFLDEKPPHHL
ncbi:hypothetical protein [Streptomyces sp. NPDC059788]|uniref:hypothetical protein n=1 Tax=Streptomyces sp. NPDC059788 TaxID=3346948 RepID=UPI00365847BF